MKTIIITVIISFIMLADLSGQWEIVRDINPATGQTTNDFYFLNQDKGFIIGNFRGHRGGFGTVSMTIDGGKTWKIVLTAWSAQLCTCIFVNDIIGFAGGIGLYQTTDGGVNWIKVGNGLTSVKDIFFVDEQTGFIAADTSIYKSSNGGGSWGKILYCKGLSSIFFVNDSTGWAVGEAGLILKLTDKGTSVKIASGTSLPLTKVFFADRNTGWIVGGYNNASDGLHPVILKTVNGGESWFKIENANWLIRDLYFRNSLEGWAVGEDKNKKGIVVETNNGGNNWSVQIDSLRTPLIATCFKDDYGWALGNGLVLKKDFSIITWTKEINELDNRKNILFQNYPNPFSSKTVISYQLPVISNIELSVYNVTGRIITTLVKERQQPGRYEVEWNAEGMQPGLYLCELKAWQSRLVRKMIVLKDNYF